MFHRLIYHKNAPLSQENLKDFSTKNYTCVKLMRTNRGKPVAILESNDTKNWHWRVQYGFSCLVFKNYAEAVKFCRNHFSELKETADENH